jgi:transcriptional regulator with XRE-family HTH domain
VYMADNVLLAAHMKAAGLKQAELAQRLNVRIEELTGKQGTLQDRHVRNWLTGRTRWPQERQRRALEAEFHVTALELGFVPRSRTEGGEPASAPASAPPEVPVRRRGFTIATASLTAAALLPVPNATARPRVGMRDVDELERAFDELVAADNARGGTVKLETRALAFAHHAMERQSVGTATERVRSRLYHLAAAFTGTALWAAVDDHRPDRAQRHLERGLTLARLSGNPEVELRLWSHAALLNAQRKGGLHEAIAAAQTARNSPACRRDPLYASLALARLAGVYAQAGFSDAAMRTLDHSRSAFDRADPEESRPAWIGFFDEAELHGLAALIMERTGRHGEAEAHLHQTLSRLRPQYRRNRTYYTANLALAQLHQGDVEDACATALSVLPEGPGASVNGRTGRLLARFDRELNATAPGAACGDDWAGLYAEWVRLERTAGDEGRRP